MSGTSISISLPTSVSIESLPEAGNHDKRNHPEITNICLFQNAASGVMRIRSFPFHPPQWITLGDGSPSWRIQGKVVIRMDVRVATICIQRAWRCHHNRKLFKLLKHAIRAAESSAAYGILKKVSPLEAELLKDPGMQCKVRFRFAGSEFPPFIVFKIFHCSSNHSSRYLSGKRVISPSSEASMDACKLMGHRTYYDQVIYDQLEHQTYRVTDTVDVATFKDYIQYTSHLDETPAHLGGRDNFWRRLSLQNMPRTTIVYDIVNYAESRTISDRLKGEIKLLLQIPKTEDIQQRQISAVTQYRSPAPPPSSAISTYLSSRYSVAPRNTSRRSHKARLKVQKMKRLYGLEKEGQELIDTSESNLRQFPDKNTFNQVVLSDDWEEEAEKLYAWSQGLSLEESGMSSPLPIYVHNMTV